MDTDEHEPEGHGRNKRQRRLEVPREEGCSNHESQIRNERKGRMPHPVLQLWSIPVWPPGAPDDDHCVQDPGDAAADEGELQTGERGPRYAQESGQEKGGVGVEDRGRTESGYFRGVVRLRESATRAMTTNCRPISAPATDPAMI